MTAVSGKLPAELVDRARAVRVEDEVERRGVRLRGRVERVGPCPLCGGTDRFSVNTAKQLWNCRGCGVGGRDAISLVMHIDGINFRAAVETLSGDAWRPSEPRRPIPTAKVDTDLLGLAAAIWDAASPIAGTAGEDYLRGRRINLDDVPDDGGLRWHPRCPWEDRTAPCIVARYTDAITAKPRGVWRRPIDGGKPKSLGSTAACVIRLWPDDMVELGLVLGEGVETTLAAATRITYRGTYLRPAWAAGSAVNMSAFPPLAGIEALTLLVDRDKNGAGERAAEQCATSWRDAGKEVIRLMPGELGDFNDLVKP